MATNKYRGVEVESVIKTKKEIVYEYRPIIGEVLGYWRIQSEISMGDTIEIHLKTPLESYDKVIINGKELDLKSLINNK